jgi:pimeloyl-ACP methyl ester carboxylesterase
MSPIYQNPTIGSARSVLTENGYSVAFIEFGEQGSYQDTSQIEKAVDLVRSTPKPVVITYVHGWHNNADSGDVPRFKKFLSEIAHTPLIQGEGFHVVGVYLGWRGESVDVPGLNELTFYGRKAAAERLASNFDCFDAISSVAEAARKHHRRENEYTILLGHSFGGLVVERAVAHAIDAEMHGRATKYNSMPADLTLVLNPASDSILSRQIISALYQEKTENARPLFVSVTSTADSATGTIFPIGTTIAAIPKTFNQVSDPGPADKKESERNYYTSTPGHKASLINYVAVKLDEPFDFPPGRTAMEINLSRTLSGDRVALPVKGKGPELWQLKRTAQIDVPYWDIQVDPTIIKNHGDIWNERAKALMAGVFGIANPVVERGHRHEADLQKPRDFKRAAYKQDNAMEIEKR